MAMPAPARFHVRLLDWLRGHDVDYEIHEHRATSSALGAARADHINGRMFAKVVGVVTDDDRVALLVVEAPDRVDLRKARAVLGARRVELLDEVRLAALTPGCETGAMPAVGALFGLPMHADQALRNDPVISFNAGTHRVSVRVDRSAWERATAVRYADLAVESPGEPRWAF